MRIAEAAITIIIVVGVLGGAFVWGVRRVWARRTLRRRRERLALEPWRKVEHSDGEMKHVLLVKPGEDDIEVGAVPFGAVDYESRLIKLRDKAQTRLLVENDEL